MNIKKIKLKYFNKWITILILFIPFYYIFKLNSLISFPNEWDTIDFFSTTIFQNKFMPFSYNIGRQARFIPFQMLDYNIVLLFPQNLHRLPLVYQFLNLKFLILLICLYNLIKYICKIYKLKFNKFIFFSIIFISIGYSVNTFTYPVYSEFLITLLFYIFSFTYLKAKKTQNYKLYIISFLLMFYMTYCKEIVFLIFLPLAIINILFNKKNISILDRKFYYAIFFNAVIFLLLYITTMFLIYQKDMGIYHNITKIRQISQYISYYKIIFQQKKFLILCIFIYIYNIYNIIKRDKYFDLHLLCLSGCVYMFIFLILCTHIWGIYYYDLCLLFSIPVIYILLSKILYKKILYVLLCIMIFSSTKDKINKFNEKNRIEKINEDSINTLTQLNQKYSICNDIKTPLKYEISNILKYINHQKSDDHISFLKPIINPPYCNIIFSDKIPLNNNQKITIDWMEFYYDIVK